MGIVQEEQKIQFQAKGFVLLSGLIEESVAEAGATALLQSLAADREDPSTWNNIPTASVHKATEILACFTQRVRAAAAELCEEGLPELPQPEATLTLNIFPQEGEWWPHGPHIDHALERDEFQVFPRPMRIASITYLNDVPKHGAPTVVWPGSHKKIEALAKTYPEKYARMATLNRDLSTLDLGEPIEIPGRVGDILFYHYLTAHSGSTNATQTPRLALVHKW